MRTEIVGEKIILRKYEAAFAPLLFEAASESKNDELSRWLAWCHEDYALADSESFVQKTLENWANKTQFGFAIFDAETNEFLGGAGLNQPNKIHGFYNLGYWIRASKRKRGARSGANFSRSRV